MQGSGSGYGIRGERADVYAITDLLDVPQCRKGAKLVVTVSWPHIRVFLLAVILKMSREATEGAKFNV